MRLLVGCGLVLWAGAALLLPHVTGLGIAQGMGNNRLRVGPIKMFIDGSLIGRLGSIDRPGAAPPPKSEFCPAARSCAIAALTVMKTRKPAMNSGPVPG